jgi:hypothetical protein
MYANAVVKYAGGKEVRVFCSPGARLSNIYTAVEFPALKAAFEAGRIGILNYPCAPQVKWNAGNQEVETIQKADPAIEVGGIPGTYKPTVGGITARADAIKTANTLLKVRQKQADPNRTP